MARGGAHETGGVAGPARTLSLMDAPFQRSCEVGCWYGAWWTPGRLTIAPGVVRCIPLVAPDIEHRTREIKLTGGLWPLWIGTGLVLVDARGSHHYVGPFGAMFGRSWGRDVIDMLEDCGFVLDG